MSYEDNTKLKITENGIEIPDIETIYNSIINEWNEVFGGNLRTENRLSPQGQLAMSIARQIDAKNRSLVYFVNQFNTNTATGNFLDYQYNNFGIYRTKGTKSEVLCQCTLKIGTTINIGDEIQNANGDIFLSTEEYTAYMPESLTFEIPFYSKENGAIPCKKNTLTTIVTKKEGWLSVDNEEDGIPGDEDTPSKVTCQCELAPGTTINVGDEIADNQENIFVAQEDVSYPDTVVANILFIAKDVGEIECEAHTLTTIVTEKEGWVSVDNDIDGKIGTTIENDDQFRIRSMNSHSINALGTEKAIYARLMELNGVQDVVIISNRTKDDITEDGITITGNSTYICICYDNSDETKNKIAKILHLVTSAATYIGNTTVNVPIENAPNNMVDEINFQTAQKQYIYLLISIKTLTAYSETTNHTIKKIVLQNFNGEIENIQKCRIGEMIEASRFFENLVYLQGTNEAIVQTIQISDDNQTWENEIKIPITAFPYLDENTIEIKIEENNGEI